MEYSVLTEEASFIGASWTSLKTTESCLLTTDRRLLVHNVEDSTWILGTTLSSFSCPGVVGAESYAFGVRGQKKSQKIVKFEKGSSNELLAVDLETNSEVFQVIPLTKDNLIAIIYVDGTCECRSFDELKVVGVKIDSIKPKTNVIAAKLLSNQTQILLATSNKDVVIIRILNQENGLKLDREIIKDAGFDLENVASACFSEIAPGSTVITMLADVKSDDDVVQAQSVSLALDTLRSVDGHKTDFKLPGLSVVVDSAPGGRLIGYNSRQHRIEAWDVLHGVLLDTWALDGDAFTCSVLSASPSGRSLMIGDEKRIRLVTINTESEPVSLARALSSMSKQPLTASLDSAPSADNSKKRKKRSKSEDSESNKRSRVHFRAEEANLHKYLLEGEWNLIESTNIASTRCFDDDEVFVKALQAGQLDWIQRILSSSADIAPSQIAHLVKLLLRIASGLEGKSGAAKAIEKLGSTLFKEASGVSSKDKGVTWMLVQALTSKGLMEGELIEALPRAISSAEHVIAVVAGLIFAAERADQRSAFETILRAIPLVLDSRPNLQLTSALTKTFVRMKQLVGRELAVCEKFGQVLHKLEELLDETKKDSRYLAPKNAGEYRTETIRL